MRIPPPCTGGRRLNREHTCDLVELVQAHQLLHRRTRLEMLRLDAGSHPVVVHATATLQATSDRADRLPVSSSALPRRRVGAGVLS